MSETAEAASPPSAAPSRYGALGDDPSFLLIRAGTVARARGNRAVGEVGLRTREYSVLSIAVAQAPTQKELADLLVLNPSQVVALVDRLEHRGLVSRVPSPTDRRAKIVSVTAAGRALQARAQQLLEQTHEVLLAPLTPAERDTLLRVLPLLAFPAEGDQD